MRRAIVLAPRKFVGDALWLTCKALVFAGDANFKLKLIMQNEMRMLNSQPVSIIFLANSCFCEFVADVTVARQV